MKSGFSTPQSPQLNRTERRILQRLTHSSAGPVTLATAARVKLDTAGKAIKKLEAEGLIRRVSRAERAIYEKTPAGLAALQRELEG